MSDNDNSNENDIAEEIKALKKKIKESPLNKKQKKSLNKTLDNPKKQKNALKKIPEILEKLKKDSEKMSEEPDESLEEDSEDDSDAKPTEDQFVKLAKTKDFKRYIRDQQAIGKLPEDLDLDALSEDEVRQLTGSYHGWVQAGKPRPTMNKESKKKVEQILRVYRRKEFGKEKLYYVAKGKDTPVGVKKVPTYRTYNDKGETKTDKTMVIAWHREYTIKYTAELAKKLMERCVKESPEPKFYLAMGHQVIPVRNPKNFTGDFDKLMQQINNRIPI